MTDLDYEESRVSCPNCGTLNEANTGLPCSMCSYIGAATIPPGTTSPERPLRRHLDDRGDCRKPYTGSAERAGIATDDPDNNPVDGTTVTDDVSTREGLDAAHQPADVDDGWPVSGCVSRTHE